MCWCSPSSTPSSELRQVIKIKPSVSIVVCALSWAHGVGGWVFRNSYPLWMPTMLWKYIVTFIVQAFVQYLIVFLWLTNHHHTMSHCICTFCRHSVHPGDQAGAGQPRGRERGGWAGQPQHGGLGENGAHHVRHDPALTHRGHRYAAVLLVSLWFLCIHPVWCSCIPYWLKPQINALL